MNIKAKIEGVQLLQVKKFWIDVWIDEIKYRYIQYVCDGVLICYKIRKENILIEDENINKLIVDYLKKENYINWSVEQN